MTLSLRHTILLLVPSALFMAIALTHSGPAAGQDRPQQNQTGQQQFEEEPFRPMSPRERVTFNLEDADLPDLIRLISSITGKRFIVPGKIRSIKATVYAPTKVTAAEAYRAFLSILELNGLAVVPAGRYLKVVESSGIENQPIPTYTRGGPTPADDRYLTRMQRLENISAEDAVNLLTRFKSREGQVSSYGPTNTLILTDTGSNIRRMIRVIRAVDVPQTGEQIWIEPIHYADANELASRLQEIFPTSDGGSAGAPQGRRPTPRRPNQPNQNDGNNAPQAAASVGEVSGPSRVTKILADERTNSLILLATERAYLRLLEMIRALDIPLEGEGGIHVHYVQHGDAEEIASTLASLTSGSSGAAAGRRQGGAAAAAAQAAGGTAVFEGEIAVTAHAPANALVITSSLHDYASLRRVIERLDAPRRQVFIEAVIMELSLNRTRNLGLSFHGGVPDFPEDGAGLLAGSGASQSLSFPADPSLLTGLALGIRGPNLEGSETTFGLTIPAFGIVLNALASTGDINVLSTPHLIAMDNEEAEITVGQNVPLQTSQVPGLGIGGLGGGLGAGAAQGAAGLGALSGFAGGFGGVQRQDVGTTLRVTPHINEEGQIRLEIDQEISEADAPSQQGNLGVVTVNRRTAQTQVVVKDQQTVVIGGLIRDVARHSENKIPILGDIPILGMLFRQESTVTEKRNLLLFLTPYIIRDQHDLRSVFERKMRERQEFIDRYFVFGEHDYDPVVDYTRTRGLLAEIVREIDEIEAEQTLLEEAARQPPREHIPRPAVGTEGGWEDQTVIGPNGVESAASEASEGAGTDSPSGAAEGSDGADSSNPEDPDQAHEGGAQSDAETGAATNSESTSTDRETPNGGPVPDAEVDAATGPQKSAHNKPILLQEVESHGTELRR